jgi:thymidylate synthase
MFDYKLMFLGMLRGEHDSTILHNKGVKIWDANGSREFLDKLGFTSRPVGELGPVYGYQWRRWNAPFLQPGEEKQGKPGSSKGIDQIAYVTHNNAAEADKLFDNCV